MPPFRQAVPITAVLTALQAPAAAASAVEVDVVALYDQSSGIGTQVIDEDGSSLPQTFNSYASTTFGPAINNSGEIAFSYAPNPGVIRARYRGYATADNPGYVSWLDGFDNGANFAPVINDNGYIAYMSDSPSGGTLKNEIVLIEPDGTATRITPHQQRIGSLPYTFGSTGFLSTSAQAHWPHGITNDRVYFTAVATDFDDDGQFAVMSYDLNDRTYTIHSRRFGGTWYGSDGLGGQFRANPTSIAINRDGIWTYTINRRIVEPDGTARAGAAIYVSDALSNPQLIAYTGDPAPDIVGRTYLSIHNPAINDQEQVAFRARLDDDTHALYLHSPGSSNPVILAQTGDLLGSDPITSFVYHQIDNLGRVIFEAFYDGGRAMVMAEQDEPLRVLMRSGDMLELDEAGAKELTFVNLSRPNQRSINNDGLIAFQAGFADGSRAVLLYDLDAGFITPGDLNGDGRVTNQDIQAFVLALTDAPGYAAVFPDLDPDLRGDFTGDGLLTSDDIPGLVNALTGSAVPVNTALFVPEPGTMAVLGTGALLLLRRGRNAMA